MSGISAWFKALAGAMGDATDFLTSAQAAQNFGSASELIDATFEEVAWFTKPAADGMASTTTAATKGNDVNGIGGCYSNCHSYDLEVYGLIIVANATLTADAANFATISVLTDDAADSAPAAALALSTTIAAPGSGNWAVDVAQRVTSATAAAATKGVLTPANTRLRPGANVFISIGKSGTGVVVPICQIGVLLRKR